MSEYLDHLYQEIILDHNRNPRNFKEVPHATASSHGVNPLCGDDYRLTMTISDDGIIEDIGFQGAGCAISKSSASMMTAAIKNKNIANAKQLAHAFQELVTSEAVSPATTEILGRLKIFAGVKKFPVRVKCAMLIWRALEDALEHREARKKEEGYVSTEDDTTGGHHANRKP